MGNLSDKLAERKEYYKKLNSIVESEEMNPLNFRPLISALREGGFNIDYTGVNLFSDVLLKLLYVEDLICDNNPNFNFLFRFDRAQELKLTPSWSGRELMEKLKLLKDPDGREFLAVFASVFGRPTIVDAYDADDVDSFLDELKQIDAEQVQLFMARVNSLVKRDEFVVALSEYVSVLVDAVNGNGEYDDDLKDTLDSLYMESSVATLLGNSGSDKPVLDGQDGALKKELLPVKFVIDDFLVPLIINYYFQYDCLHSKEVDAIETILNQQKYKDLIRPAVDSSREYIEKLKQKSQEQDNQSEVTVTGAIDTKRTEIHHKLRGEKASQMFDLFVSKGYFEKTSDGGYNWVETKVLLAYFVMKASHYLKMSFNGTIDWAAFEPVILCQGSNVIAKNLSDRYYGKTEPNGYPAVDQLFKQLEAQKY